MTKKTTSFAEYEANRTERMASFEQAADKNLETRMQTTLHQIQKRHLQPEDIIAQKLGISLPQGFFQQGGFLKFLKTSLLAHEVLVDESFLQTNKEIFSANLQDLVHAGINLARANPESIPNLEERKICYSHFYREVIELSKIYSDSGFELKAVILDYSTLPLSGEGKEIVLETIRSLQQKQYLTKRTAESLGKLLYPPERKMFTPANGKNVSSQVSSQETNYKEERSPVITKATSSSDSRNFDLREREEYLRVIFGLNGKTAELYSQVSSLEDLRHLNKELAQIVGEEQTRALIKNNPDILAYPSRNLLTRYLANLTVVIEHLHQEKEKTPSLEKEFGLENNFGVYSSLDSLLHLKENLFQRTGYHSNTEDNFDVEDYKTKLLERTELYPPMVRALTEGKNSMFKGEYYMPKMNFRKNALGRVSQREIDEHFETTFEAMIKQGAIYLKAKTHKPTYRLNEHLDEITDAHLREYIRITFYGEQMLAQEGKIKPEADLFKEIYQREFTCEEK